MPDPPWSYGPVLTYTRRQRARIRLVAAVDGLLIRSAWVRNRRIGKAGA